MYFYVWTLFKLFALFQKSLSLNTPTSIEIVDPLFEHVSIYNNTRVQVTAAVLYENIDQILLNK